MENLQVTQVQGVTANELIKAIATAVKNELQTPEPQPVETYDLMSKKEVAKMLRVSLMTINNWTKQGLLTSYRIGNRVMYKKDEVLQSLKAK
ncbi:helix-turn-helix domain-containing protein [Riemerella anatipestifer]|uniref:helix-turn-helix domain-containing protein n=1 Tax=Riemerella anatipestifer TaxID=34085 RepID=UPI0021D5703D|nr:helix-turn-helix domain-containing protein [Riemerella anatipestifer]MCU7593095.1 helix-turn-helix domain-containing protein [Riemerella anatipestifer]MCU7602805.1 helix-turn-helix domain-containing protein [Riemerella anatipestifer]MCU7609457.1 helix-turn-helix domain-containing protein [Riemerella anatipestifer]MCU7609463.1 helix-turn-helix domain-containing protein [Riemerella anatipestifer]MDR7712152.1 helix-turn-helix domain-containing protein [Riemerella anatipestifer]